MRPLRTWIGPALLALLSACGISSALSLLDVAHNPWLVALLACAVVASGTLLLTVDAAEVGSVAEQLVASGLKPDTPLTVTCAGTTTSQLTVNGTLGEAGLAAVSDLAKQVAFTRSPAMASEDTSPGFGGGSTKFTVNEPAPRLPAPVQLASMS